MANLTCAEAQRLLDGSATLSAREMRGFAKMSGLPIQGRSTGQVRTSFRSALTALIREADIAAVILRALRIDLHAQCISISDPRMQAALERTAKIAAKDVMALRFMGESHGQ